MLARSASILVSALLAACLACRQSPPPAPADAPPIPQPAPEVPPPAEPPTAPVTPPAAAAAPPAGAPVPAAVPPSPGQPGATAAAPSNPGHPGPATAAALVREATALQPGGAAPLSADAETRVDPSATFRVELAAPSGDARLVLLDAADAAVPAKATQEVGASTRLTLAPTDPLVPGQRYLLRLDGAVTRELHHQARPYAPTTWALKAAGEPPPAPPKAAKAPTRKKHRSGR